MLQIAHVTQSVCTDVTLFTPTKNQALKLKYQSIDLLVNYSKFSSPS